LPQSIKLREKSAHRLSNQGATRVVEAGENQVSKEFGNGPGRIWRFDGFFGFVVIAIK